jgi:hypothetical protein
MIETFNVGTTFAGETRLATLGVRSTGANMPTTQESPAAGTVIPEIRMSKYRAEAYLRRLGAHEVIYDIYDSDEMLQSALISTIPNFEFPDWSYKTIGDVLKKYFPK